MRIAKQMMTTIALGHRGARWILVALAAGFVCQIAPEAKADVAADRFGGFEDSFSLAEGAGRSTPKCAAVYETLVVAQNIPQSMRVPLPGILQGDRAELIGQRRAHRGSREQDTPADDPILIYQSRNSVPGSRPRSSREQAAAASGKIVYVPAPSPYTYTVVQIVEPDVCKALSASSTSAPPAPAVNLGNFAGTWQSADKVATIVVSASGSATTQWTPSAQQSDKGNWTNCTQTGGYKMTCDWKSTYTDADKTITRHGKVTASLSGDSMTADSTVVAIDSEDWHVPKYPAGAEHGGTGTYSRAGVR